MGSIIVKNLGKSYKQYPKKIDRLLEWFSPFKSVRHTQKWVLKDINFSVSPGDSVGIIGINGAGKSTLLKMITGTTSPTTGEVITTGRVSALLELGMGFHPNFTGRQNVMMAGQLIGIPIARLRELMPSIESFAEIGSYIDQPVRVYSSGMQVRLAFSLATAIRPDVLIIDEALSVGDTYFKHKSFERIKQFRKQGTTLLIVSHDKNAIQTICDRAILLNGGKLEMEGDPETVMDYYNALLADNQKQKVSQSKNSQGKTETISGTGQVKLSKIQLLNDKNEAIEVVGVGQPVTLRVEAQVEGDIPKLVFGYGLKDRLGQVVYGTNTYHTKQILLNVKSGERVRFDVHFDMNVGAGSYSVQTAFVSSDTHLENNYEWRDQAYIFNVVNFNQIYFLGSAWIPPKIEVNKL